LLIVSGGLLRNLLSITGSRLRYLHFHLAQQESITLQHSCRESQATSLQKGYSAISPKNFALNADFRFFSSIGASKKVLFASPHWRKSKSSAEIIPFRSGQFQRIDAYLIRINGAFDEVSSQLLTIDIHSLGFSVASTFFRNLSGIASSINRQII